MPVDVVERPDIDAPDTHASVTEVPVTEVRAAEAPAVGERTPRRRGSGLLVRAVIGFAAFLVVGNALILGATVVLRHVAPAAATADGIAHVHRVDGKVIRGAAPTEAGLRDLAAAGVTTVVDLRAEVDRSEHERLLDELGIQRFHLPVRDGQLPSAAQAAELLRIVDGSPGRVFLHCGAGVGRTGAMAAWYLNATGQTSGTEAMRRNLAVGPPSLEQLAFSLDTADGEYRRPSLPVTALSRVLDAPRRLWHHLT